MVNLSFRSLMRLNLLGLPCQQPEHRHPHGHPVGDLLQNSGLRAVGYVGADLDAAIDRPGGQDQDVVASPWPTARGPSRTNGRIRGPRGRDASSAARTGSATG